ncbi:unnamed protein product [Caenorhabditis auriculariae]|uniref:Sdz-33 F-box domain-containing protein n=1 Tax=Caenorhabditis auriculariae TaxID=2777116 RepID=A0A8S1HIA3_9PELO|nr:unnamed protein product [Caenorhabditis auriculariae]
MNYTLEALLASLLWVSSGEITESSGSLKQVALAFRAATATGEYVNAIVTVVDVYGDATTYAFSPDNDSSTDFLYEHPLPEITYTAKPLEDAFSFFVASLLNVSLVGEARIVANKLTSSMNTTLDSLLLEPNMTLPIINAFHFSTYDVSLIRRLLEVTVHQPERIRISFFSFAERMMKLIDNSVLDIPKVRRTSRLLMDGIQCDAKDEQLLNLSSKTIQLRSLTLTSASINTILKHWQDGSRELENLRIVTDDLQRAEVMTGVQKKTISRNVWRVRNRAGVVGTVSISRSPTIMFDPKPTFEFSINPIFMS